VPRKVPRTASRTARPSKEGGETQYTFTGNGGPNVGNFFNKVLYSIKFQSSDLLLSDGVNDASQILYERNPRERVRRWRRT
jgi:uncharacterized membrane protein (UPF0182 family)